jgi:hypothetical protein
VRAEDLDAPVHHPSLADAVERDLHARALERDRSAADPDAALVYPGKRPLDRGAVRQTEAPARVSPVEVEHRLDRDVERAVPEARDPIGQSQHVEEGVGCILDATARIEPAHLALGPMAAQQRLERRHSPEGRLRRGCGRVGVVPRQHQSDVGPHQHP